MPAALSKKSGGQITTQSAEDDEVPDRRLYRVVVRLEGEALPLLVGMRGTCQLDNPADTVGEWLYRAFYRTFPPEGGVLMVTGPSIAGPALLGRVHAVAAAPPRS